MSKEAFIYWTRDGQTTVITADANISVSSSAPAEVTDYYLEDGAEASDHIVLRPETLTLELVQTETPLPPADVAMRQKLVKLQVRESQFEPGGALWVTTGIHNLASAGLNAIGLGSVRGPIQVWAFSRDTAANRIADFHKLLLEVRASKTLLKVTVAGTEYPDYVILDVNYTQTGLDEIGSFTLPMKHVRTAPSTAKADALGLGLSLPSPNDLALAAAQAAAEAALETTPATEQAVREKTVEQSLLSGMADSLGI